MNRRRRTTSANTVLVAVLAAVLLSPAPRAHACSCMMVPPFEVQAEEAELVFTGRQVDQRPVTIASEQYDWAELVLVIEVTAVYKGDVADTIELLAMGPGSSCYLDLAAYGELGFALTPMDDGAVLAPVCGGLGPADALRLTYEPLPGPVGRAPPGFLVGVEVGPVRVAILDTAGQLLTFGGGPGRLVAAAVCPGGERVVEMVNPTNPRPEEGEAGPLTLDVRRLRDLAVESSLPLPVAERHLRPSHGVGAAIDLQCHDPDGTVVSYLSASTVWDGQAGYHRPGPANVHLWDDGHLTTIPVGRAVAVAVDPVAERVHAIVEDDGRRLVTRDLGGDVVDWPVLPDGYGAWGLALSADRTRLAVLANSRPGESWQAWYATVDQFVLLNLVPDGIVSSETTLPNLGNVLTLHPTTDGFVAAIRHGEPPRVDLLTFTDDGGLRMTDQLRQPAFFGEVAIGADLAVVTSLYDLESGEDTAVARIVDGEAVPVEQLPSSRLVIALPAGVVVDLPAVETSAPAPATTTGVSGPDDALGAGDPVDGEQEGTVEPAGTEVGTTTSLSPVAVATWVLAVLAAVLSIVAFVRRRRARSVAATR